MRADLHLHSRFSDGAEWPEALAARAAACKLEYVALTDHDSMEGVKRFLEACRRQRIRGVAGVEIDCVCTEHGYDSELLGYFPNGVNGRIESFVTDQLQAREDVIKRNIEEACRLFNRKDLSVDEIVAQKEKAGSDPTPGGVRFCLTRRDLWRYLKTKETAVNNLTYDEFREKYCREQNAFSNRRAKPHVRQVIEEIRGGGGFPVLPHPGLAFGSNFSSFTGKSTRFRELLGCFAGFGLWGVELYRYGDMDVTRQINAAVKQVGGELGLGLTYGSDSHGPGADSPDYLGQFAADFAGFQ